ncbi:DUF2256 domain-containing protein [Trinickia dabaoshanensis]|uniref:DUF2256 domain-containing protein n=1 Tax=Trinickia dabaoshanensis TaxID=564714 RepID=A0A2N7VBF7_9BURK|nr:DUF2256 domain-containing protein [Trinickia dabaoshanensis]
MNESGAHKGSKRALCRFFAACGRTRAWQRAWPKNWQDVRYSFGRRRRRSLRMRR